MKVAIYLRVSSDEQAERGHGIAFQREGCRQRAGEMGCSLVKEFVDEGESGAVLARPALDDLREDVAKGLFDAVIVWDPDRLSRNLAHQLVVTEEIERHCRLIFVRFERDDSPEGQLFYQMRGAIAQYEREKIRERTMAGRRQKAMAGRLPFAAGPYGYAYDAERANLTVVDGEATVVRRIFRDYASGNCSLNGLARQLTVEGIPTRRGAAAWHRQTIRQILSNPIYMGIYYANRNDMSGSGLNKYRKTGKNWGKERPLGEWIPVKVPALVDEGVWNRVQEALGRRAPRRPRSHYLLSGLAVCGICGQGMTGARKDSWGRKTRYYTCHRNLPSKESKGCSRYVRAGPVEDLIWAELLTWLDDAAEIASELDSLQDRIRLSQALAALDEEMRKVEEGRRRLLAVLERGLATEEQVLASLERLSQRENMLSGKACALREGMKEGFRVAFPLWETVEQMGTFTRDMPFDMKKQILGLFVKSVEIGRDSVRVRARVPPGSRGHCHEQGDLDVPESDEACPDGGKPS